MVFGFRVSVVLDGFVVSSFADFLNFSVARINNGMLLDMFLRKFKEKLDKRKDVVKFFYFKFRRVSGRLVGRKVFVEIFKKKYTRRFRE